MSRSSRKNWLVFASAVALCGGGVLIFLDQAAFADEALRTALRLTARLAFLIFLVVFVARPLVQVLPSQRTRWLLRERRSIGIAFCAVFTVHLALIVYRYLRLPDEYDPSTFFVGGIAYGLVYLMFITSFDGPAHALGTRNWRRLHKAGLYYVGLVFLATLLPYSRPELLDPAYLWFVALTALALVVRLTAWFARRKARGGL